jgi:nucleoside-diphosphate-sugar epimerase
VRVLVTGHQGYVGSVLTPLLRAAGHQVVGLDTGLFTAAAHGPGGPTVTDAEIRADVRDATTEDLAGIDAVAHLAALSNDPLGDLEPERTFEINHAGAVRLAERARAAGVGRFIFSSSCSTYGAASPDDVVAETGELRPETPYAESKVLVERDLHTLATGRFSPVSLRNATAYGWSPRLRCDLVANDLVGRAHLDGEVRVLSDGTPWRPLVHVEDIARAFLAALEAPREAVHDEVFNVGSPGGNYQVRDIARIVAGLVGCKVVITGETGPDTRSYRVDFDRVTQALPAFRPQWTVERGVAQVLAAYRSYGLSRDDFGNTYRRLPWLLRLRAEGRLDEGLRWVAP